MVMDLTMQGQLLWEGFHSGWGHIVWSRTAISGQHQDSNIYGEKRE